MNYSNIKNFDKYKTLTISVPKEFVFMIQLNRSEKLNALNDVMWKYVFTLNFNLNLLYLKFNIIKFLI